MPLLALGTDKMYGDVVRGVIRAAMDIGYRHIDTAALYRNEADIGKLIATTDRHDLFLTTKCWMGQYRDIREACLGSLERLQTSYLDLYLLHWPFAFKPNQPPRSEPNVSVKERDYFPLHEVWKQMEGLVREGLVRDIGVSNWTVALLNDMMGYATIPPSVNHIESHIYNARTELIQFCLSQAVVPMGYRSLFRPENSTDYTFLKCALDNEVAQEVAKKYGRPVSQILLRWHLQRGAGCLARSSKTEHLVSNWNSQFFELEASDMETLNSISENGVFEDGTLHYNIHIFK